VFRSPAPHGAGLFALRDEIGVEIEARMFHACRRQRPRHEGRHTTSTGGSSMKRRDFIKVTGIGVAGAASLAAPAIAQSMPEIKWRMPTSWPKSLDTLHGAAEMMAKVVGEATDNKFQIQTFAAGEIVPGLQVLDAVQNGTVEMGHTASYYYFGKDPTFTFGSSVPFGPNMRINQAWYMLGGGKEILNTFYKKYNVTSLLAGNTGCQMGGWFRKEVKSVDDLKGLKFRIGGFAGRVMQKLGCVPQQLAGGDIYPALEKGTIDAAEWVGPYDDERLGFYKVAPHYYYPGWWEGGPMLIAFVNLDKWNALPKYYQSVLEQAGHYANNWMMAKYDQANPPALRRLLAGGAKLHGFSPEIMEASHKAAKELHSEVAASNADFKKVYESLTSFSNTDYSWFQVAELSYDYFMSRHAQS
jgi:TRAP-type mannitol/chloroaromatic compound transport system substrate-binding protein